MATYLREENGVPIWDPGDGSEMPDFYGNFGPPPPAQALGPTALAQNATSMDYVPGVGQTQSTAPQNASDAQQAFANYDFGGESGGMSMDPSDMISRDPRSAEQLDYEAQQAAIQARPPTPAGAPQQAMPQQGQPQIPLGVDPALFQRQMVRVAPQAGRPADWQNAQRQISVPDERKREVRDAQQKADDLARRAAEAQVKKTESEASLVADLATEEHLKKVDERFKARKKAAEMQGQHNAVRQAIDDARQELKDAGEIDPDRLYKGEGGGWNKVRHMIAMALGGYLQGSGRTANNPAAEVIQKEIDRDIAAQRAEREAKRDKLSDAINEYDKLVRRGITPQHAEQILKDAQLAVVESDIQRKKANWALGHLEPNADALLADVQQARAANMQKLETSINDTAMQRWDPGQSASAGGVRMESEREYGQRLGNYKTIADIQGKVIGNQGEAYKIQQGAAGGGGSPDNVRRFGESLTKGDGVNMMQMEAGYNRVDNLIQEMKAKYGGELPYVGGFKGKFPDAVISADALRLRTAMRELTEMSLRNYSGAAAPEKEKKERQAQVARISDLTVSGATAEKIYQDNRMMHNDVIRGYAAPYGGKPTLDAWRRAYLSTPLTAGGTQEGTDSNLGLGEPVR